MNNSSDKILVVARKYNDIFYAISTSEWSQCSKHYLLMITDRLDQNEYPMQHLFDKVWSVHAELSHVAILKQVFILSRILNQLDYNLVTISNIVTVANLYILNHTKTAKIIMLEDGFMNYYNFVPSNNRIKRLLMKLLFINVDRVYKKIGSCYLLEPNRAKYYFGLKKQLRIDADHILKSVPLSMNLEGKSIFVGQPLCLMNNMSVDEYSTIVNNCISQYAIDYYLSHTMSSKKENVVCEHIDMSSLQLTLEVLSSIYNMKIYSFSSSVLFTTKLINHKTETFAVTHPKVDTIKSDNMIYDYVNGFVSVN